MERSPDACVATIQRLLIERYPQYWWGVTRGPNVVGDEVLSVAARTAGGMQSPLQTYPMRTLVEAADLAPYAEAIAAKVEQDRAAGRLEKIPPRS